jgi:hypothetical protein
MTPSRSQDPRGGTPERRTSLTLLLAFSLVGLTGTVTAQDPAPAPEAPRIVHGDAASGDVHGQEPPPAPGQVPVEVRHRPRRGVPGTLSRSYLPAIHPGAPGYAPARTTPVAWKTMGHSGRNHFFRPGGSPAQRDLRKGPPGLLKGPAAGPRPFHAFDARLLRPAPGLFRAPGRPAWGATPLAAGRERLKPLHPVINGTTIHPAFTGVNGTTILQGKIRTGSATINGSEIRIRR